VLLRFCVTTCLLAASLAAQSLQITGGVTHQQVFQRDPADRAVIPLEGTASGAEGASVAARVLKKHLPVKGLDWQPVAEVEQGRWSGELAGVPAGGPYTIEVKVEGESDVETVLGVLVGDLWILAGQSNMQGVGDLENVEPGNPMVHSFNMADRWVVAEEPLHRLVDAVDSFHWRRNPDNKPLAGEALRKWIENRRKGAGLGLPFANELTARTGVPIGLIPCAHGGTSMDQWSPELKDEGSASLYGAMLRRFRAVGGKVTGVLWYQGESDANPEASQEFLDKFENFVAAVRRDFGQPDLPFFYVQIGRFIVPDDPESWNRIQEMQRQAETAIPRTGMAAAIDLELDDLIHVGTQDLKRLGVRLANLAGRELFSGEPAHENLEIGPRPASVYFEDGTVRVEFEHVNGALSAGGRISGFSVHDAEGKPLPAVYDAFVDPAEENVVVLELQKQREAYVKELRDPAARDENARAFFLPEGAALYYGYGKDPYCNLTDDADMAVPAFGPLSIE